MIPLVSILIPVFNCEAWVANAIESAFAQTWQAAGAMTPPRLKAWSERALSATRTLYQLDRNRVALHLERLQALNPRLFTKASRFSARVRLGFSWLGFYAAERLADATRSWRRRLNWQAGTNFASDCSNQILVDENCVSQSKSRNDCKMKLFDVAT
jgi:hypothetical protein